MKSRKSRLLNRLIPGWVIALLVFTLTPTVNHMASIASAASGTGIAPGVGTGTLPGAKPTVPFTPHIYNFETTLSPWTGNTLSGSTVTLGRYSTDNSCPTSGTWYADLKGTQGTASTALYWMQTSFPYPGTSQFSVLMEFKGKVKDNCAECKAAVYIGTDAPTSASQFTTIGDGYIPSNWEEYEYLVNLTGVSGPIYMAFGYYADSSGPSTIGFDCAYLLFPF